jgi:transcriptional regulator with XRE-family HTH domain
MSTTGQGNGIASIVGSNIKRARTDRRLKQRELGALLHVGPQQVSDWERGAYKPNDTNLIRLAEALGKDFAWFYTEHETERAAA